MENEKLSIRASKLMMQTKLTSLYSSKSLKANGIPNRNMFESDNSSKECAGVENRTSQNGNRHPTYLDADGNEKSRGQLQNAKWKHTGFKSPVCEVANSPSSNDEADAPANEFTTAKRMMVCTIVRICTFIYAANLLLFVVCIIFMSCLTYLGRGLVCKFHKTPMVFNRYSAAFVLFSYRLVDIDCQPASVYRL
jgi:hypothetical protein